MAKWRHVPSGLIVETDADLSQFAYERVGVKPDVDGMTVKELAQWCGAHGIESRKGWKRADYLRAIREA